MSWTTITSDTSWQDRAVWKELVTAYNKRADICDASAISIDMDSENTTVYEVCSALQTGIESLMTRFANRLTDLNGQSSLLSNFATLTDGFTAAGISAGWRRIAEGGTQPDPWTNYGIAGWSRGKIQSKDLAGPWLMVDIQSALSSMRRRVYSYSGGADGTVSFPSFYSASDSRINPVTPPTYDLASKSGDVSWSAGSSFVVPCRYSVTKTKYSSGVPYIYTIESSNNISRVYAGVYGSLLESTALKFVFLINSSSTSTFESITGWPSSSIGKTISKNSETGASPRKTWCNISYAASLPWSSIEDELPNSDVPDGGSASRELVIEDVNFVADYSFSPA